MSVKAIVRGGVDQVRTLKLAHTAAVEAGDVIVSNGQVLVAVNAAEADAENIYVFRGPVEFPKDNTVAMAAGDVVYFDAVNNNIDKTNTNTKAGIVTEAAAQTATVVLVELGENK